LLGAGKMATSAKRYLRLNREKNFPYLTRQLYEVTDNETNDYNCIGLAAGDKTRWWEPEPSGQYYWPIPNREYTVRCYTEAFESLGYQKCICSLKKRSFEKVAIYHDPLGCVEAIDNFGMWHPEVLPKTPTHAAKQLPSGEWNSKLGGWEEIKHKTLSCLNGTDITGKRISYGKPIQILKRPLK
jgi:hypothetical protein